jgi:hypothetical protein
MLKIHSQKNSSRALTKNPTGKKPIGPMNHEPNLLPEQCQPEELIIFLGLWPRYLSGRENGDL